MAFLRFYEDGADELMSAQSGCLYATVLAERQFAGSAINALVAKAELAWRTAFVDLLRPAITTRRPGPDIDVDVEALADHLFTTFEGGFVLCRTLENTSAMGAQLRVFRQLVEALLGLGHPSGSAEAAGDAAGSLERPGGSGLADRPLDADPQLGDRRR